MVERRYAVPKEQRTFESRMEIFQTGRPISAMVQGSTLRVIDQRPIHVVWSTDNWETRNVKESRVVGTPGSFVDIETAPDQTGSLVFTLFWPGEERWLGKDYEVAIHERQVPQTSAATKPKM